MYLHSMVVVLIYDHTQHGTISMEILTTPEKKYRIENHQAFVAFIKPVELLIDPVMVNPVTGEIDDDRSLNTELNFWCEVIAPQLIEDHDAAYHTIRSNELCYHMTDLDCGAKTYELLIDRVYTLFMEKYGDYDGIAYDRGLRNRKFMYSYSGIEAYISEDMLYLGNLEKDKSFLGDLNNFIKSVSML